MTLVKLNEIDEVLQGKYMGRIRFNSNRSWMGGIGVTGCYLVFSIFLILLSVIPVSAEPYRSFYNSDNIYFAVGQADVKANELVYCQPPGCPVTDYKLSQLIWESKGVGMLVAGVNLISSNKISLNLEARVNITEGDGVMDDYDWLYVGLDWSHWSHHEDTKITEATSLDINFDYSLYQKNKTNLSLLVGFKQETWAWESRGGTFIYSDLAYRDWIGSFTPGQLVITYEQRFEMPYLGFRFSSELGNWFVNAQYLYSNAVTVEDTDYHVLRDLIFEGNFETGTMSAYNLQLGYKFSKHFNVFARYDVVDYQEVRGGTTYIDTNLNAITGYCTNCAGADNANQTVSMGASLAF